jgi:hypothetical protein
VLAGILSLLFLTKSDTTLTLAARFVLIGLGFGLFQAPNLSEILHGVKPSLVGLAASTNAVLKNLGSLVGITLLVSVFAGMPGPRAGLNPALHQVMSPFSRAFAVAVLVAALNLLINLLPRQIGKFSRPDLQGR